LKNFPWVWKSVAVCSLGSINTNKTVFIMSNQPRIITESEFQSTSHKIELNQVYNMAYEDFLPHIPKHYADCAIVDLPFNVLASDWDKPLDLDALFQQYEQILKPSAPLILFSAGKFTFDLYLASLKSSFKYKRSLVWERPQGNPFNCRRAEIPVFETLLVFGKETPYFEAVKQAGKPYKKNCKVNGGDAFGKKELKQTERINTGFRYQRSVMRYGYEGNRSKFHTCLKPQLLLRYLCEAYCPPNGVILDNTAGSFSLGLSAIATDRNHLSCEKEASFCEVGLSRLQEQNQKNLTQSNLVIP
jgi:DNA modification methylase